MMGGDLPGSIEVTKGVRVTLEPTTAKGWFGDRLREIDGFAQTLASTHGLDANDVRGRLLWVDGWRINVRTTKTPPWMEPHRELESHEVVRLVNLAWFPDAVRWYESKNAKKKAAEVQDRGKGERPTGRRVCVGDAFVAG